MDNGKYGEYEQIIVMHGTIGWATVKGERRQLTPDELTKLQAIYAPGDRNMVLMGQPHG